MFILGLTGPSGSGKTMASEILVKHGFAVVDADQIAHDAVRKGTDCLRELTEEFGRDIINEDGSLNRKRLAAKAFSDKNKKIKLNLITHPHILKEIVDRVEELQTKGMEYVVLDAPALLESGAGRLCDRILVITADHACRLDRILARDTLSEAEAEMRMKAQPADSFYTQKADYVIHNDGNKEVFVKKVEDLAAAIRAQAK